MSEEQEQIGMAVLLALDSLACFFNILSATSRLPGGILDDVLFMIAVIVFIACAYTSYLAYAKSRLIRIRKITEALTRD